MKRVVVALICVAPLLACPKPTTPPPPAETTAAPPQVDVRFQERVLWEIPQEPGVTLRFSPPLDDWEPYTWYTCSFSPDGVHFAYVALREGKTCVLVVDGKTVELPEDVEGVSGPKFGPSGRLVYRLSGEHGSFLVIDGVRTDPFEESHLLGDTSEVQFSPDGRRYVYQARMRGTWYVVVDGVKTEVTDSIAGVIFSKDGSRIAWRGAKGLFVDGSVVGPFREPAFSDDGKRLAYTKSVENGHAVVVDGRMEKAYDRVGRPVFSPRGDRVAYSAMRSSEAALVVVNGRDSEEWTTTWDPLFTPDGRMAYVASSGDGTLYWVAEEDERVELAGIPSRVTFDASGRHVAYQISGQIYRDHRPIGYGRFPVLDPTGKHVAYLNNEQGGGVSIGVDGKKGERFHALSRPVFSPDGKKLAYGAVSGPATSAKVVWKVVTVEP
ncbi:MAG: PD40 domain-containing protein [Planctomycetes bacterium]|nr:PD40 domain-containing protein [Planctomycetota bacterium]